MHLQSNASSNTALLLQVDSSSSGLTASNDAQSLLEQAEALRVEAKYMEKSLHESKEGKKNKATQDIDRWIDQVLIRYKVGQESEVLNSVEQATQILKEDRFSPDQVEKMFERLCATCPIRGRDSLEKTPILALLIEACGKLDELDREENPNKRWNGHVERDLRKKLFAREWGINLHQDDSKY